MAEPNKELAEFQKRAIDLLAHKFLSDYRRARANCQGEEMEHFWEVWSKNTIIEISLRELVWKRVMWTLTEEKDKDD